MAKNTEPLIEIPCAGCGRVQRLRQSSVAVSCEFYTCSHGSCKVNPAFQLPTIPDGMIREEHMQAAAGFTGYRLRIATIDERESIARARAIRDMAVAGLYRRGEEV
jgi:hypothetical protein